MCLSSWGLVPCRRLKMQDLQRSSDSSSYFCSSSTSQRHQNWLRLCCPYQWICVVFSHWLRTPLHKTKSTRCSACCQLWSPTITMWWRVVRRSCCAKSTSTLCSALWIWCRTCSWTMSWLKNTLAHSTSTLNQCWKWFRTKRVKWLAKTTSTCSSTSCLNCNCRCSRRGAQMGQPTNMCATRARFVWIHLRTCSSSTRKVWTLMSRKTLKSSTNCGSCSWKYFFSISSRLRSLINGSKSRNLKAKRNQHTRHSSKRSKTIYRGSSTSWLQRNCWSCRMLRTLTKLSWANLIMNVSAFTIRAKR